MISEAEKLGEDTQEDLKEIFMGINIPRSLFEFDYLDLDRMLQMQLNKELKGVHEEDDDPIYDKLTGILLNEKEEEEENLDDENI